MPMVSDLDIYHAANVLIRQHGEDATLEAAMRTDIGTAHWIQTFDWPV